MSSLRLNKKFVPWSSFPVGLEKVLAGPWIGNVRIGNVFILQAKAVLKGIYT
jgi:hypothetical protein